MAFTHVILNHPVAWALRSQLYRHEAEEQNGEGIQRKSAQRAGEGIGTHTPEPAADALPFTGFLKVRHPCPWQNVLGTQETCLEFWAMCGGRSKI